MKLSKINKLINGIKTDIGIIKVGSKIKFNNYGNDYSYGVIVKINKKEKIIEIRWDDSSNTEEESDSLEDFELVK